ncbi:MAG TPA: DUF2203 family protein [Gemmataceae bacterium]|jgi:hypothetical protein|nr:DUF2203 family protein [Gemmataceae bacterium]
MTSKPNRASSEKTRRKNQSVDLITARRMLPLVQRIVSDFLTDRQELNRFQFEEEGLERNKRNLSWPERQRRYAVQGELVRLEGRLEEEQQELAQLGAILVNEITGQIGFPTLVNGRPAFFSWQMGEENVIFWHFDGEMVRRPIPPNWNEGSSIRLISQR